MYSFGGAQTVDPNELAKIRDHMRSRGPDGKGLWLSDDQRVGLGHRRLAIIDLSDAASQPMASANGDMRLVYNGQMYNYREERARLEAKGHRFTSTGDTEVLLRLYEEHGEACVEHIRGMFAFAIWDSRRKALFIARDGFGIKPLYYAIDAGVVRVASQVKALLAGGYVSRDPSPAGVTGFYLWGSVPEPHTFYRQIKAVPAGSSMTVTREGAKAPTRYWSLNSAYQDQPPEAKFDAKEVASNVREAVRNSVEHHLVADVPVGVFLSAGVDSSALVALASEIHQGPVRTVTLAFEEFRGSPLDETELAERTARQYGTAHTTITITKNDFVDSLPAILEAMDQPTVDGINTYFVARAAAQTGLKVALSGLGGDELFGGYPSFRNIPRAVRWLSLPSRVPFVPELVRWLGGHVPLGRRKEKLRGLATYGGTLAGSYFLQKGLYMPWELDDIVDRDLLEQGRREYTAVSDASDHMADAGDLAAVASLEMSHYMRNQLLRDCDWAGMAHSLEIRTPLVDCKVHDTIANQAVISFSPNQPKRFLWAAARPPLPDSILNRPKSGFSLPMQQWIAESLPTDGLTNDGHWSKAWARYTAQHSLYRGTQT